MEIIRVRLKPYGRATEFITIPGKIKSLIEMFNGDEFHFVIDDNGVKTVKEFGADNINAELVDKVIPIKNSIYFVKFNKDGTLEMTKDGAAVLESLPRQQTVDQLKALRKKTKGIDIGDRISDLSKEGSNIQYCRNAVDKGIESYEDFEKNNQTFVPSWNLKHLKPFRKGKTKKAKK